MDEDLLTAKQLASQLGETPRVIRKFLRAKFGQVGQGARWSVRNEDVAKLMTMFQEWRSQEGRSRKPADVD